MDDSLSLDLGGFELQAGDFTFECENLIVALLRWKNDFSVNFSHFIGNNRVIFSTFIFNNVYWDFDGFGNGNIEE